MDANGTKLIALNEHAVGKTTATNIVSPKGVMLIAKGTALTPTIIRRLRVYGISQAFVCEKKVK